MPFIQNKFRLDYSAMCGSRVVVGLNAMIVGDVSIDDTVMISPNAFVDFDIPSHCVFIGNLCVIHHKANVTNAYFPIE